ncbi:MAG: hypothetical protein JWM35_2263 [Verrucomicrobia bacterium]|nr:hypothetical protein [Verrucomicrobiota bacterium]
MSTMPSEDFIVRHNAPFSRFEAEIGGKLAVADYRLEGKDMLFTHTFVPPEMRGRGAAEKLVRAALEWARAQGRRVVPQCSYVAVFIERHAEYQDLVKR